MAKCSIAVQKSSGYHLSLWGTRLKKSPLLSTLLLPGFPPDREASTNAVRWQWIFVARTFDAKNSFQSVFLETPPTLLEAERSIGLYFLLCRICWASEGDFSARKERWRGRKVFLRDNSEQFRGTIEIRWRLSVLTCLEDEKLGPIPPIYESARREMLGEFHWGRTSTMYSEIIFEKFPEVYTRIEGRVSWTKGRVLFFRDR